MSDISDIIEELNFNFEQLSKFLDLRFKEFTEEKARKLDELKPLIADSETPPGILIAAQMAALRRTYNCDKLAKARYFLKLCRKVISTMDDLPKRVKN